MMIKYLSLFLFTGLTFGKNLDVKTVSYFEKNKLSINEKSEFNWRLFRNVKSWYPTIGHDNMISIEEFFAITRSTKERQLFSQNKKIIKKNIALSALSSSVGLTLIIAPQTGYWGVYVGLGPLIVGQWLIIKANKIIAEPIISFDEAKNIADDFNKRLLFKNR